MIGQPTIPDEIVAVRTVNEITLNASHPAAIWHQADLVAFSSDWQSKNPDPERETQVQALWSAQTLYLRFECRYRELFLFDDSDPDGRRDQLWNRDVAEAFLQPDPSRERYYKEFEVSPNGMQRPTIFARGNLFVRFFSLCQCQLRSKRNDAPQFGVKLLNPVQINLG